MKRPLWKFLLLLLLLLFTTSLLFAQESSGILEQSKVLLSQTQEDQSKWIEEKRGEFLPLDLVFTDENGEEIVLADIIDRPTIFLPIYFYCPNICSKSLANLAVALGSLAAQPGVDYRVIALSFSEVETPEVAAQAKENYIKIVGSQFPADEWKFLTGSSEAIRAATDAVGYRFKKNEDLTFIHPAALMIIGADGKIIRYVYGSFLAGDIDMGIADAVKGVPSLSVKRLLSFCFNYDPDQNKSVFQYVKIGVLAFFFFCLLFVFLFFKQKKVTSKQ